MTPRRALAPDFLPAVGWTATPSTPRALAAALLFAPLVAFAQQAATTDTSTAPAPAAHENSETPRRPGETTTGRPPAPAVPAPATTPTAKAPPTAPLPGDGAVAADTNPPVATAPVSPTSTAPLSEAPRVSMPASMPTSSTASPGAGGLLKTILALMLVLGLLAGLAWVMKRYGPKMSGGSANLRVVGALNLGGRERIMVVEVGDQWIVVGAAPGRVNALHTMPRQEADLTPAAAHGTIPANNFSDWLKKTIDKRNAS
ncbi:flagellar biosynthetic protein FliO [Massilia sp. CFBP9012]|uniref:flagellar biosynthetic protein FliO n=1 Tax=Massilia sp. CFBP9012 TaxID=3096531 RepID=UPI002A6B5442|nr:flagellar biosynthetic protein FliO [Massilia sp. CFBP9012]MDY0977612.1 flagellar biosynthetic protein FliO [Massilia sp. CFBP9012]